MRRVGIGLATVVVALGATVPPAHAIDTGVVSAASTFSGNTSCFDAPGTFRVDLEFTGTLAAGGQTFGGTFVTSVAGTYVQGPCSIRDVHGGMRARLTTPGPVTGTGAAGTVGGTCGPGSFETLALTGATPLPEPQVRAVLDLLCDVSVSGGAVSPVDLHAELVGAAASYRGVYTTR